MTYEAVYLGFSVATTPVLLGYQASLCRRYGLIPRPELHITVGYLGTVTRDGLVSLGHQLRNVYGHPEGIAIAVGVGGAYLSNDGTVKSIVEEFLPPQCTRRPRTVWLAVRPTSEIVALRNALVSAAIGLGLDTQYLRAVYTPHVTIGSNGPAAAGDDYALWDVHSIEKTGMIPGPMFGEMRLDRLHLTSMATQPLSIDCLRCWPSGT